MFKKMTRKLSGLKNRASWSWGCSWPKPDRLQVIKSIFNDNYVPDFTSKLNLHFIPGPSDIFPHWNTFFSFFFAAPSRTGRSAEICEAFPDFHQQGQGSPVGPLPAGPFPGHGGSNRAGGWVVSRVHWVGQGWEENLPTAGSGGEEH